MSDVDEDYRRRIRKSFFDTGLTDDQRAQLTRAMKFYPWDNNSGGFFVCIIHKKKELNHSSYAEVIEKNAINYEKVCQNEEFCANMSRNLPLHPQHKITNTQILDSIREQFKLPYFFEPGDYENTLVNASQREMEGVTASRVYLLNKHVQQILYSSKDSY